MAPNLIPLLALGLERIEQVIILVGMQNEKSPTTEDQANAVKPARRFEAVVRRLGGERPLVRLVKGPWNDEFPWAERLAKVLPEAPTEILFNHTAGTKAMSLGAFLHLLRSSADRSRIFAYDPAVPGTARPRALRYLHPETKRAELPQSSVMDVESWFRLHGYRVVGSQETTARARASFTEAVAAAALETEDKATERLRQMTHLFSGEATDGTSIVAEAASVPGWLRPFVESLAASGEGVRREGGRYRFDVGLAQYFESGWFEELVFLAAERTFGDDADARCKLRLQHLHRDDRAAFGDASELDVCVFRADQLHIIECKIGVYAGGKRAGDYGVGLATVAGLRERRTTLVGPYGLTVLVNPRPLPSRRNATTYMDEVRHSADRPLRVDLALGWGWREQLDGAFRRIAASR